LKFDPGIGYGEKGTLFKGLKEVISFGKEFE